MSPWQIVLIVLVIVVITLVIAFIWLRNVARQRTTILRQRFPAARAIISGANFFGQESRGIVQLRGNGTLVITDTDLYFEKWLPRKEYHIPLANIQAIEMPRVFLRKSLGLNPLLKVVYRNSSGQQDAMAWFIPDLTSVKQLLETRTRG